MGSMGARAYNGVCRRAPNGGPGAEFLVSGLGGVAPEAKSFFIILESNDRQIKLFSNYKV